MASDELCGALDSITISFESQPDSDHRGGPHDCSGQSQGVPEHGFVAENVVCEARNKGGADSKADDIEDEQEQVCALAAHLVRRDDLQSGIQRPRYEHREEELQCQHRNGELRSRHQWKECRAWTAQRNANESYTHV